MCWPTFCRCTALACTCCATAIFEAQPFERRLRDMHAVAQQVQASAVHLQSAGQHLLGLQPPLRYI